MKPDLIYYIDTVYIEFGDNGVVFDFGVFNSQRDVESVVRLGCSHEFVKVLIKKLESCDKLKNK
jgi:hypothetical protein